MNAALIEEIRSAVTIWGDANFVDYPWRSTENPWLALVAEVLLQRTNAKHVAARWEKIEKRWPTPESVLEASDEELAQIDQQFGLNRRATTLRAVAEHLDTCDHYLLEEQELLAIYGIGHYTASAYLSLHMNRRAVLFDANVARWLSRLMGIPKPKDLRQPCPQRELAGSLTPGRGFRAYNYAVLDLTMQVCRSGQPRCAACPLSSKGLCEYQRTALSAE
ncbi:hypothetical protein R0135_14170 [Congregibacter variabilis]|uniref:HhH-GPD domain-containing protein n=1 Tax=Congregibacter variabilis TaxID=3081200 RepID=A0ABZ0I277_9GAMM|nr:hypothetical protein R0135_14170 [Congregibacter sp. IMCC43200]